MRFPLRVLLGFGVVGCSGAAAQVGGASEAGGESESVSVSAGEGESEGESRGGGESGDGGESACEVAFRAWRPGPGEIVAEKRWAEAPPSAHIETIACLDKESEEACRGRAEAEAATRFPGDKVMGSVSGTESEGGGVSAAIEVDGERRTVKLPSTEAVSIHLTELAQAKHRVTLLGVERDASSGAVRTVMKVLMDGPPRAPTDRVRLRWSHPGSAVEGMQSALEAAEAQGLELVEVKPESGQVILTLACPAAR